MAKNGCVWLRMVVYGYEWLRMAMYGCVWLRMAAYGYEWLCIAMNDCVWLWKVLTLFYLTFKYHTLTQGSSIYTVTIRGGGGVRQRKFDERGGGEEVLAILERLNEEKIELCVKKICRNEF